MNIASQQVFAAYHGVILFTSIMLAIAQYFSKSHQDSIRDWRGRAEKIRLPEDRKSIELAELRKSNENLLNRYEAKNAHGIIHFLLVLFGVVLMAYAFALGQIIYYSSTIAATANSPETASFPPALYHCSFAIILLGVAFIAYGYLFYMILLMDWELDAYKTAVTKQEDKSIGVAIGKDNASLKKRVKKMGKAAASKAPNKT
jgi:hypothetical protein